MGSPTFTVRPPMPSPYVEGPFTKQLTEPFPQRTGAPPQATPAEADTAGNVLMFVNSILGGAQQGRVKQYLMQEKASQEKMQSLASAYNAIMADPNVTDEAKAKVRGEYFNLIGQMGQQAIKEGGADKKNPVVNVFKSIFEGMTGGQLPKRGGKDINPAETIGNWFTLTQSDAASKPAQIQNLMGEMQDQIDSMRKQGAYSGDIRAALTPKVQQLGRYIDPKMAAYFFEQQMSGVGIMPRMVHGALSRYAAGQAGPPVAADASTASPPGAPIRELPYPEPGLEHVQLLPPRVQELVPEYKLGPEKVPPVIRQMELARLEGQMPAEVVGVEPEPPTVAGGAPRRTLPRTAIEAPLAPGVAEQLEPWGQRPVTAIAEQRPAMVGPDRFLETIRSPVLLQALQQYGLAPERMTIVNQNTGDSVEAWWDPNSASYRDGETAGFFGKEWVPVGKTLPATYGRTPGWFQFPDETGKVWLRNTKTNEMMPLLHPATKEHMKTAVGSGMTPYTVQGMGMRTAQILGKQMYAEAESQFPGNRQAQARFIARMVAAEGQDPGMVRQAQAEAYRLIGPEELDPIQQVIRDRYLSGQGGVPGEPIPVQVGDEGLVIGQPRTAEPTGQPATSAPRKSVYHGMSDAQLQEELKKLQF